MHSRRHVAGRNTGPHGAHCSHSGMDAKSVEGTDRAGGRQNSIRANQTYKNIQSLSVVTVNAASWASVENVLPRLTSAVILVQEHRLLPARFLDTTKKMAKRGWT
eukprot:4750429-Pyramimonas_sp.AAC.1